MSRRAYRTYATETNAIRRAAALQEQWPARRFILTPAPDGSFRWAVATDNGKGGLALCA
jgi:hypothetical protein